MQSDRLSRHFMVFLLPLAVASFSVPSKRLTPFALTGCGSDNNATPALPNGCTKRIAATGDYTTATQTALVDARSGDVICFDDGTYEFTRELTLSARGVTIKSLNGSGATWDFRKQAASDRSGLLVSGDGFKIENIKVKNTAGDGIRAEGVSNIVFRKVRVSWDQDALRKGSDGVARAGAYALYPVKATGVLIEDCEVTDAADAGIYVGQSSQIIVRRNKVYRNVAGIEIENSVSADVYDNEAFDNTTGVLVFNLPNLERQDGRKALIRNNKVYENNRKNFGAPGSIVAGVPEGLGFMILSADETEIANNEVKSNNTMGVLIVSCKTNNEFKDCTSKTAGFNQYPMKTYIHDNTFSSNGTSPSRTAFIDLVIKGRPVEDIVWDGYADPATPTEKTVCLKGNKGGTFRNMGQEAGFFDSTKQSTSTTAFECELPALPQITLSL